MVDVANLTDMVAGRWANIGRRAATGGTTPSINTFIYSRAAQFFAIETLYHTLAKPDVILGFIPLYQVQYLEVGRSQDILQYRSIGAEFLGHQKGGNLGIRIDFIIPTSSLLLVPSLYILYYSSRQQTVKQKGTAELKDELELSTAGALGLPLPIQTSIAKMGLYGINLGVDRTGLVTGGGSWGINAFQSKAISNYGVGPVVNPESFDDAKINEAVDKNLKYTSPEDETYDESHWHNTFPIITSLETIFDCYIETLMFRRDTKDGGKMLRGTILLRQFHPPDLKDSERLVLLNKGDPKDALQITASDWEDLTLEKEIITKPLIPEKKKLKSKLAKKFGITEIDFDYPMVDGMLNRIHQGIQSYANTLQPYAMLRYKRDLKNPTGEDLMLQMASSVKKTTNSLNRAFKNNFGGT